MANYKHKRSTVAGRKPTTSQIQEGEIAINLPDKKMFTKYGSEIIEIGGGLGPGDLRIEHIYDVNGGQTWYMLSTKGQLWSFGRSSLYSMGQGWGSPSAGYNGFRLVSLPYKTHTLKAFQMICDTGVAIMEIKDTTSPYRNEIWTWGRNNHGNCGDGTTTSVQAPKRVERYLKNFDEYWFPINGVYATAGMFYYRNTSGKIVGFGRNIYGRLGNGSTAVVNRPTEIGIPAGYSHSDVVDLWNIGHDYGQTFIKMKDNTLWACGYNAHGQLGIGNYTETISTWTKCNISASIVSTIKEMSGTCAYHNGSTENRESAVYIVCDSGLYSTGHGARYFNNGFEENKNVFTRLTSRVGMKLHLGSSAGMHFYEMGDGNMVIWGNDDLKVWNSFPGKYGVLLIDSTLRKGQESDPNFTYTQNGYYMGYRRIALFWWPDGRYYFPTSNHWGSGGHGIDNVNVTFTDIDHNYIEEFQVPISEDETIIQFCSIDHRDNPTTFALTDKGTVYACGHNGTDWNDMPSMFNQYRTPINSTWRRLV